MLTSAMGKHRAFELYSLAKPSKERIDRDKNDIEYQTNCNECTFAPNLKKTKKSRKSRKRK
jgi:hypothetical protein